MRPLRALTVLVMPLGLLWPPASAATYSPAKPKDVRKLNITRVFRIPVVRGQENIARLPAMMSFWGSTNQQVILESELTYSVKPDKIEVTADNPGMPCRNYQLTWIAPTVSSVTVTQKLTIELTCTHRLYTAATLPYSRAVRERLASSLGADKEVNPGSPKVAAIAQEIGTKARYAEHAVELACDWVNDNVKFQRASPPESDTVLASGRGNCTGMANLACAILRHMGIPAELVGGKFIGGDGGHAFIEAYFPDAGWVFYDLSNATRAFKSLDCLLTVGWGFRTSSPKGRNWHQGLFCVEKDVLPYKEDNRLQQPPVRPGPKKKNVAGARVILRRTPMIVRVRHLPISRLIMDLTTPPGVRKYAREAPPATGDEPASKPVALPKPKVEPAGKTQEKQATAKLKLAEAYAASGLKKKAAAIYRMILEKYPDTDAAKAAKAKLSALESKE